MIRAWFQGASDRSGLLSGRVDQSLWLEMLVAATVGSALMAVVAGVVVLGQGGSHLRHDSEEVQRQLSSSLTSFEPLYNVQRDLQRASSSREVASALVIDQRGLVLAASNSALVGLPIAHVLQLPAQHPLRGLFTDCPSAAVLLSCLTRDQVVSHGPIPLIGGELVLAMRQYPLALEGAGGVGSRATLITITDASQATRGALIFMLTVFLAGLVPLLAGCGALVLRLRQRLIPELLRLAQMDALSGVYNRRAFMETGADLLRRAQQIGQPMALALIDVDHFKQINDTYGHDAGDVVIRQVSNLLRESVRSVDLVGRLGGDEFVFLVQLPPEAATQMLERTLAEVRATDMRITPDQPVYMTLSVGVASSTGHAGYELGDLMTAADAALYVAKDRGRAQVVNLELEAAGARQSIRRVDQWQVHGA